MSHRYNLRQRKPAEPEASTTKARSPQVTPRKAPSTSNNDGIIERLLRVVSNVTFTCYLLGLVAFGYTLAHPFLTSWSGRNLPTPLPVERVGGSMFQDLVLVHQFTTEYNPKTDTSIGDVIVGRFCGLGGPRYCTGDLCAVSGTKNITENVNAFQCAGKSQYVIHEFAYGRVNSIIPYLGTVIVVGHFCAVYVVCVAFLVHTLFTLADHLPINPATATRMYKFEVSLYVGIMLGMAFMNIPIVQPIVDLSWPVAYIVWSPTFARLSVQYRRDSPDYSADFGTLAFLAHICTPFLTWGTAIIFCNAGQYLWSHYGPAHMQSPGYNLLIVAIGGVIGVKSSHEWTRKVIPAWLDHLHGAAIETSS